MSKQHLFAASLFILLFSFFSCPVPFFELPGAAPGAAPEAPSGMGYFSLSIDTTAARTILPTAPVFATYVLSFVPNVDCTNDNPLMEPISRTETTKGDPVLLRAGTWDLLVQAHLENYDPDAPAKTLVASGLLEGITINGGALTSNTVTLKPIVTGDDLKGTFRWTINYPSDLPDGVTITSAAMTITSYATGDIATTETLTDASTPTDTELPTGYYRVDITLKSNNAAGTDEKTAALTRILHIQTNMVSPYTQGFTASNFSATLGGTVTIDGTAAVGQTLTANITALGGTSGTIYYQWKRNGVNIPGETNSAYTVKLFSGNSGNTASTEITVEVYRAGYNGSVISANDPPVTVVDVVTGGGDDDDDVPFIITGNTTVGFTAKLSDIAIIEDQPIQDVITAIRTVANGTDCTIQFGNGTDVLDMGDADAADIRFNTTGGTWGEITLTGSITSDAPTGSSNYLIGITDNVSINSMANITHSRRFAFSLGTSSTLTISDGIVNGGVLGAIYFTGAGTRNLNILGGTITASAGWGAAVISARSIISRGDILISGGTVTNTSSGAGHLIDTSEGSVTVTITGGTVSATNSDNRTRTINAGAGAVTISGGEVRATIGTAIYSEGTGLITIREDDPDDNPTLITSRNTDPAQGTIHLSGTVDDSNPRLLIEGGTVQNTANSENARAIYNNTNGGISITSGTVEVVHADAYAVYSAVETAALSIDWDNADVEIIGQVYHLSECTWVWIVTTPLTVTTDGVETETCSICHATRDTRTLTAPGTSGVALTKNADGTYSVGASPDASGAIFIPGWITDSNGDSIQITHIATDAFRENAGITSVTISEGVTTIGNNAFRDSNITSVTLPDSLTTIGSSAFYNCSGITSVTIPYNVTTIGSYAFSDCRFTTIEIPRNPALTAIGGGAFASNPNLTEITIPSNITSMGYQVFISCTNLRTIVFESDGVLIGAEGTENQYQFSFPNGNTLWEVYPLPQPDGGAGTYTRPTPPDANANIWVKSP